MITFIKNYIKSNKLDISIVCSFFILPYIFYYNVWFNPDELWMFGDGVISYWPGVNYLHDIFRNGSFSLWNNMIFLGIPYIESLFMSIFYLPNWLFIVFEPKNVYNIFIFLHFSLGGTFTYYYLRELGISRKAAVLGGIAFMLSGSLHARRNHINLLSTVIWLPLIFLMYERAIKTRKRKYFVLSAIAFVIPIYIGMVQMALYMGIVLLIYCFMSYSRFKGLKDFLFRNLNFFILTLLFAAPILIMFGNAYSGTVKDAADYSFFISYSLPLEMLTTFLFPNLFGIHIPDNLYKVPFYMHSHGNLSEFGLYAGVLPLFTAIFVTLTHFKKEKYVRYLSVILIVAILLSVGGNIPFLSKIMFKIPVYNMFRVPARWLFIVDFSMIALFAIGIDKYLKRENKDTFARFFYLITSLSIIVIIAMCLFAEKIFKLIQSVQVNGSNLPYYLTGVKDSSTLNNNAVLIPIVTMLSYSLWIYVNNNRRYLNQRILYIVLVIILIVDLSAFSFHHENLLMPIQTHTDKEFINKVNELTPNEERVWPILYDDSYMKGTAPNLNFGNDISILNGYGGVYSENIKTLLGFVDNGVNIAPVNLISNNDLLSTLNVKYLIVEDYFEAVINSLGSETELISEFSNINFNNGGDLAIVTNNVNIRPNTSFVFKLELENEEELDGEVVIMDLYGEGYDTVLQELVVKIDSNIDAYEKTINSASPVPEIVDFRLFTFSQKEVKIKKAEIHEIVSGTSRDYKKVYAKDGISIIENLNNLDKIYLVNHVKELKTLDSIYNTDLFTTALIEHRDCPLNSTNFNSGEVLDIEYKNGRAATIIKGKGEKFVVFSEAYRNGWQVYIDGEKSKLYQVNGLIQGTIVPNGTHEVEFVYRPDSITKSFIMFLIALIYTMVFLTFDKINRKRKK